MRPLIWRRACAACTVDGTLPQMEQETIVDAAGEQHESAVEADDELLDELLIEEISIDGMCGVC